MKVKVLQPFRDINDFSLAHNIGDVIDVDDARAARLIELGLAETEKKAVQKEPDKAADTPPQNFMQTPTEDAPKFTRKRKD